MDELGRCATYIILRITNIERPTHTKSSRINNVWI